jgi:hypothetical protein
MRLATRAHIRTETRLCFRYSTLRSAIPQGRRFIATESEKGIRSSSQGNLKRRISDSPHEGRIT